MTAVTTQAAPAAPALPPTRRYVEEFEALLGAERGRVPGWLAGVRRSAIERFQQLGFPTPRDEDWHFTSVAPIAEADFQRLRTPSGDVTPAALAPFTFGRPDWPTVVIVNGCVAAELSTLAALPAGVRVLPLARAWVEAPELVERYLTRVAYFRTNAFTALNTALMGDGVLVHVPADVVVPTPIHLVFAADANAAKGMTHPRNLVVLEHHARATVIESYVALSDATYFTNAVTEAVVHHGATLAHIKVQRESQRGFHVGTTEVHQGRDSHFVSFSFATGAALSRSNVYTTLDGAGAGATLNGLYMLDGDMHMDHQTRIEHAAPNCYSREVYKGVLDGTSHGVFNGKVYVQPIAQKTDGKQTNNTLLLSDKAQVDTKPQLEIFADDVKCTHGATVGRLDEMAWFYMKSRGMDAEAARRLLIYAFAADVLETIEQAQVREALERITLERFVKQEELETVSS
jgi:Fe-S cluster assembly protein SufD